jgi:predicted ribosomally synthesized peptide with SipW-like signal peptide
MSKQTRVLFSVLIVAVGGALAGFGVYAAFSSTTSNPNNSFAAGTVTLTDNDGNVALFTDAINAQPDVDYDRCVRVTYAGSLDANVKLYTSAISADGSKVNIQVDKSATGSQADCSDFGAATNVYAETALSAFGSSHSSYSNGLAVNPGSATNWVQNDAVTFRFRLSIPDLQANEGVSVSPFALTWEARNL